jgi:iron complex outermembrane recepter protein
MKSIMLFWIFLLGTFVSLYSESSKPIEIVGTPTSIDSEKTKSSKLDPTGFVDVIKAEDFKNRYTSLTEILERESGVRVRRFGGLGSYSTLSIRGSNANQVKIYIDGIPLNNAQGGEVNLSDLSFDNLEKIEIYKSGASSGFSGSAIGGSVNLVTKKKDAKPTTRFSISGGSLNTGKISAGKTGNFGGLRYSLQVGQEKSDQNFIFRSDNGTPFFNPYDDKDIRRKNSQFNRYNLTGNASFEIAETTVSILNDFTYRRNGIPGPGNKQTEKVDREFLRNTSSIGTSTRSLFFSNLNFDSRFFYTGIRDHLFDPLSEFSSGTPNSKADMQQYGIHLLPNLVLSQNQVLRFLFAIERETFKRDRRNRLDEIVDRSTRKFRNHLTWQVQDEIRLFQRRLILTPMIQQEEYKDRFNSENDPFVKNNSEQTKNTIAYTNYRMGLLLILWKNSNTVFSFKSNISREKRIPDFLELFGERGSIIGNLNLKPERSINSDAGLVLNYEKKDFRSEFQFSFFQKQISDMILFIPNSHFTLRHENID